MTVDEASTALEEPVHRNAVQIIQDKLQTENIPTSCNDVSHCQQLPATGNSPDIILPVQPLAHSIAPFNPSSQQAQDKAIGLLSLTNDDVLFDLGCGDGRFLISAATKIEDLRCVGIELDPLFVQRGRAAIAKLPLHVQNRVQIRQGNLLEYDDESKEPVCVEERDPSHACSNLIIREDATAIYLYLLPKGLARFKTEFLDSLVDQRMGCGKRIRIVSFMFRVHGWEPVAILDGIKGGVRQYLYEFGSDPLLCSELSYAEQPE